MWAASAFALYGMSHFTESAYKSLAKKFSEDLTKVDLKGKSYMITGANSGIGYGSAVYFAAQGGTVHMICRNKSRGDDAIKQILKDHPNATLHLHICDVSEPSQIRGLVKDFTKDFGSLDVLINNAGVMLETRELNSDGLCKHLTTNTLSTFLLSYLMLPILSKSKDPRVINVASGGMLTQPLLIREQYDKQSDWTGMVAYARTKRHQVALTAEFAKLFPDISFYSCHPGWCDTPGVQTSMPDFHERLKGNLRSIEHGCDVMNWLAVSTTLVKKQSGLFFRDREEDTQHLWGAGTHYEPHLQTALWTWCLELCDLTPKPETLRKLAETLKQQPALSKLAGEFKGSQVVEEIQKIENNATEEALALAQTLQSAGYIIPPKPLKNSKNQSYEWGVVPTRQELHGMISDEWVDNQIKEMELPCECLPHRHDNLVHLPFCCKLPEGTHLPVASRATASFRFLNPELTLFLDLKQWTIQKETKDAKVATKAVSGSSLKATMAFLQSPATKEQLRALLGTHLLERHKQWNKTFDSGHVIECLDNEYEIHYWLYELGSLVTNRDFVVLRRVHDLPDGRLVIAERSIQHGKSPEIKGIIRCDIVFQVRVIEPKDSKDPESPCLITTMNLTDIGGWFPSGTVNSANIDITLDELNLISTVASKIVIEKDDKNKKPIDTQTGVAPTGDSKGKDEAQPQKKANQDREPAELPDEVAQKKKSKKRTG